MSVVSSCEGLPGSASFDYTQLLWSTSRAALQSCDDVRRAPVAQLDRASVSEAEGRWFDSSRAHHLLRSLNAADAAR